MEEIMSKNTFLVFLIMFLSLQCLADNSWIGWKDRMFGYQISRPSLETCEQGVKVAQSNNPILEYDSWIRSRAIIQNLCFEVYQKDVTEFFRTDIDKYLDVTIKYSSPNKKENVLKAKYLKHVVNNAIYYIELWQMDPYLHFYRPEENFIVDLYIYVNDKPTTQGRIKYYSESD